ncbi:MULTISPECIES: hypothetical protein [Ramlibacter]|uniref:Uncharacterized protein n=1 Tax=Ramlibacter pinisoli TaxID=2682844 RepID=A0A6N8IU19_9BURK|nr:MULTISPECIES: hypothetical protein [Ramlibacter]MBA2965237.1 hypothetical protein [Ramlibacter sp. CGMCC 1.13660]MVQ30202.1 hypothetical protein [Ramlibacter pinisoli]
MVLRFKPCDCATPEFVRERRPAWMRLLLPRLRHWSCRHCERRFVASKDVVVTQGEPAAPTPR